MVEGARLESVFTGDRNAGSNPALSASSSTKSITYREFQNLPAKKPIMQNAIDLDSMRRHETSSRGSIPIVKRYPIEIGERLLSKHQIMPRDDRERVAIKVISLFGRGIIDPDQLSAELERG